MNKDIAEVLGKADAAFVLFGALIEYLISKNTLSKGDATVIITAAAHAISIMPDATEAEKQIALSMLTPLLEHHGRGQTH